MHGTTAMKGASGYAKIVNLRENILLMTTLDGVWYGKKGRGGKKRHVSRYIKKQTARLRRSAGIW